MKEIIYQSEEMLIELNDDIKLCEITLKHHEDQLELFKSNLQDFLDLIEQHRVTKNLWNLSNFQIVIDLELQEWIDAIINKKEIELGVEFEAFVMPQDLINQLSIEQTMEEQHGKIIETAFFSDKNEALEWLSSV